MEAGPSGGHGNQTKVVHLEMSACCVAMGHRPWYVIVTTLDQQMEVLGV